MARPKSKTITNLFLETRSFNDPLVAMACGMASGQNRRRSIVHQVARMVQLKRQGMSVTAIATMYGVQWRTVNDRLKRWEQGKYRGLL